MRLGYVMFREIRRLLGNEAVGRVRTELAEQKAKLMCAKRQGRDADYDKFQDQAYGYSTALAQLLGISWFTITDEIQTLWNFANYASKCSTEKKYQAGLAQRHYARGKVAFWVKQNIFQELRKDEDQGS